MKLKIVNKKRFIKLQIIIFGILCVCILLLTNKISSNTHTSYKTTYVLQGETLWDIAEKEAKQNQYYEGTDIRDIIQNLKKVNNLSDANIFVGEQLKIPSF